MAEHGRVTIQELFGRFARATSRVAGRPLTFALAVALVLGWAVSGPLFGYSEGWQLVINTTTTIITFLMVFLMQSTQNRDTEALQLKIDELIRAVAEADDTVIALDEAGEEELAAARAKYLALANGDDAMAATQVAKATGRAAAKAAASQDKEVTVAAAAKATPRSPRRRGGRAPRR